MVTRYCARCGKALTDAASLNHGVGPVCRKMDNYVLARLIPSDVWMAQKHWGAIDAAALPEAVNETFGNIGADLLDTECNDWRTTCKRVEWLMSWTESPKMRTSLVGIVASLGYLSLASLLLGEAAKGLATISFEDGRLYYAGPRNKAARLTTKAIPGWNFHPGSKPLNQKARWSVPAAAYGAFKTLVWKHYPKHEGLADAVASAKAYAKHWAAEAAKVAAEIPAEPVKTSTVTVTKDGNILLVASPYSWAFKEALKKEIKNWKHRRWNGADKVWEVHVSAEATLMNLIAAHYDESPAVEIAA